jgi:hypothetical protein
VKPATGALLALAALVLGACAKAQTAKPCPEARDTRCMTRVNCSYDEARDCEVCHCSPPTPEPVRSSK